MLSKYFTHSSKRIQNSMAQEKKDREKDRGRGGKGDRKRGRKKIKKIIIISSHKHISPEREREIEKILFLISKQHYFIICLYVHQPPSVA